MQLPQIDTDGNTAPGSVATVFVPPKELQAMPYDDLAHYPSWLPGQVLKELRAAVRRIAELEAEVAALKKEKRT